MWDACPTEGGGRMIRRLFTFAAAISLLLCISIAIGGVIYTPGQFRGMYFGDGTWGATLDNGIISPEWCEAFFRSRPWLTMSVWSRIQ